MKKWEGKVAIITGASQVIKKIIILQIDPQI